MRCSARDVCAVRVGGVVGGDAGGRAGRALPPVSCFFFGFRRCLSRCGSGSKRGCRPSRLGVLALLPPVLPCMCCPAHRGVGREGNVPRGGVYPRRSSCSWRQPGVAPLLLGQEPFKRNGSNVAGHLTDPPSPPPAPVHSPLAVPPLLSTPPPPPPPCDIHRTPPELRSPSPCTTLSPSRTAAGGPMAGSRIPLPRDGVASTAPHDGAARTRTEASGHAARRACAAHHSAGGRGGRRAVLPPPRPPLRCPTSYSSPSAPPPARPPSLWLPPGSSTPAPPAGRRTECPPPHRPCCAPSPRRARRAPPRPRRPATQ